MAAHDQYRAGGVLRAVLAHRAQQHAGECAVAAASQDEHLGASAGIDQDGGGMALVDFGEDGDVRRAAEGINDGRVEAFASFCGEVDVGIVRSPAVAARHLPRMYRVQFGASEPGLYGRPAQGIFTGFGSIDAGHDERGLVGTGQVLASFVLDLSVVVGNGLQEGPKTCPGAASLHRRRVARARLRLVGRADVRGPARSVSRSRRDDDM